MSFSAPAAGDDGVQSLPSQVISLEDYFRNNDVLRGFESSASNSGRRSFLCTLIILPSVASCREIECQSELYPVRMRNDNNYILMPLNNL